MTADPLRDAWEASGSPSGEMTAAGQCARCGVTGPALPWREVLSGNFGDWDKLAWRHPGLLCPACAWGFAHKPLRTKAHLIGPGTLTLAAPPDLYRALSGPLPPSLLVSVPVAGKKHIVPWAPYGVVVTDHEQLAWDAGDAARLGTLAALRALGFTEPALSEPAPRWMVMRGLDAEGRSRSLALWPELAAWRSRPSYLAVACRATRKPKDDQEADGG